MAELVYSNAEENKFWLQILGDQARFILDALTIKETAEADQTGKFITKFDDLLARARMNLATQKLEDLNKDAVSVTRDFKKFALEILRKQLIEGLAIRMLPIYISQIASSAELYLYMLEMFLQNRQPQLDILFMDTFWLPIFSAMAAGISGSAGVYTEEVISSANSFSISFRNQFIRAIENRGFTRIGEKDYPVAIQFHKDVENQMRRFAEFIVDIIFSIRGKRLPGTITLLQMDNLYREACYFTTKLAISSNSPKPACDPASPRLSNL